ncbi:MAG: hypothetical protein AAGA30_00050 [Planctomycetota bacterium]
MKNGFLTSTLVVVVSLAAAPVVFAQCSSCGDAAMTAGIEYGGSGIIDNVGPNGIGTCTNEGRWPCRGNNQFTTGNANVACPTFRGFSYSNPAYRGYLAARDSFHPQPFYAYSKAGIDTQRIDQWNRVQSQRTSWQGGYNYWQYNAPTALVVPPTAAFQTSYSWGVGGTRSLPIHHQFGASAPGGGGGISQAGSSPPYWPSSTDQLGIYPVRAPWSHIR